MKLALDIDDTITRHPEFFAVVSRALIAAGHEVLIVTLRQDYDQAEADLWEWGVEYTELIVATTDALIKHGPYEWKATVLRHHGVDVFFDDMPQILRHVDPDVTCFMAVNTEEHDIGRLCSREGTW